ncbi:MAG: hypothetical protein U9O55_02555 [Patescibacteria group bacterium]|nr:hypothetical protein [Patescibacteria group bacterium]
MVTKVDNLKTINKKRFDDIDDLDFIVKRDEFEKLKNKVLTLERKMKIA